MKLMIVLLVAQMGLCHLSTENTTSTILEEDQTTTFATEENTRVAPAPVMLKLGNSTIDSTKSFKVPQTNEPIIPSKPQTTSISRKVLKELEMIPRVVSAKNIHFDHDKKYGPTFEDVTEGDMAKITVQLGEDANLNCRISLLQDKTVSWVRRKTMEDVPELLTVGNITYAADNRISIAKRYPGNWKLVINVVKPEDEGVYECQISTHPPRVSRTYLRVNTPQVWVVDEIGAPLLEKYYESESTLVLVCIARNVDTPVSLTWLHHGKALNYDTSRGGISVKTEQKPTGADSQLRLNRVNSSDAGNYTCDVHGAKSHTVSVHVLNEESLAELHAGAKNTHPMLITATSLFLTLFVITDSKMLFLCVISFIVLVSTTMIQENKIFQLYVLLPT